MDFWYAAGVSGKRPEPPERQVGTSEIVLPLRGLASEGAEEIVRQAMSSCHGIQEIAIHEPEFLVHIAFDPGEVSPDEIREHFRRALQAPTRATT